MKLYLFIVGLCVFAYFLSANSVRSIYTSFISRSWPTTTATLSLAKVGFHSSGNDSESSDRFSFNVKYNYILNDKKYYSTRFAVCLYQESSSQALSHLVEKYKPGSKVKIFYDPKNLNYSLIDTGYFLTPFLHILVSLILILFAISLAITGTSNN